MCVVTLDEVTCDYHSQVMQKVQFRSGEMCLIDLCPWMGQLSI